GAGCTDRETRVDGRVARLQLVAAAVLRSVRDAPGLRGVVVERVDRPLRYLVAEAADVLVDPCPGPGEARGQPRRPDEGLHRLVAVAADRAISVARRRSRAVAAEDTAVHRVFAAEEHDVGRQEDRKSGRV